MHKFCPSAGRRNLRATHFCPVSWLRISSALKKNH